MPMVRCEERLEGHRLVLHRRNDWELIVPAAGGEYVSSAAVFVTSFLPSPPPSAQRRHAHGGHWIWCPVYPVGLRISVVSVLRVRRLCALAFLAEVGS